MCAFQCATSFYIFDSAMSEHINVVITYQESRFEIVI